MKPKITLEDAFQEGLAQGRKESQDAIRYYMTHYLLKNGGGTLIKSPTEILQYAQPSKRRIN